MFPLDRFFPKDLYKTQCMQEPGAIPHFLIALGQSDKTIQAQIDKRGPNYQETRFRLTALAVAVLKGNHAIVTYLLKERGANPMLTTYTGIRPLHFAAALDDVTSLQLLQEAEKSEKIQLDRFALFPGWKATFEPNLPDSSAIVCYSLEDKPITAALFQEMTGAQFTFHTVGDQNAFIMSFTEHFKPHFRGIDDLTKHLTSRYEAYLEKPPKLLLGPQGEVGLGVFAGEDLELFQICAVYSGQLDLNPESHDYLLDLTNGEKIRSLGPMINDGFPNVQFYSLPLPDGQIVKVCVALRPIKEKEPLFWNYGSDAQVKLAKRKELNFEEMAHYFRDSSLDALMQTIYDLAKGPPEHEKTEILRSGISYILHTPTALFQLVLKHILPLKETAQFMMNKRFMEIFGVSEFGRTLILVTLCSFLDLSEVMTEKERGELEIFLLTCLEKYSCRAFSMQINHFRKSLVDPNKWDEMDLGCQAMETLLLQPQGEALSASALEQLKLFIEKLGMDWAIKNFQGMEAKFPNINQLFE